MHLFYQPDPVLYLPDDESRHVVKTLRLGAGDTIFVTDGHGNRLTAVITQADARRCAFRVTAQHHTPARPFSIRIAVAPTKNLDRLEWFVEKAVELGIERISPFFGQHSERRVLNRDRLEKIAVAAMKQSLQSRLPRIDEAVPLGQLLRSVEADTAGTGGVGAWFMAHLPDGPALPPHLLRAARPGGHYVVLIGPEGDFSAGELQQAQAAGFALVTLGPNRLRTETAALAACQILNVVNVP